MNTEVSQHIENALDEVRTLFLKASQRIETIKPGEKLPATQLAEDLAREMGQTGPQVYPILKVLFNKYPGVEIRRGAHGGICKVKAAEPTPEPVPNTADAS